MTVKVQIRKPIHLMLGMWIVLSSGGAQAQTITCLFDTILFLDHDKPNSSDSLRKHQRMKIVNGKTDDDTKRLDGSVRATNSDLWTRRPRLREPTFIGDFGELLILESNPQERKNDLFSGESLTKGGHRSTLTNSGLTPASTQVSKGNCLVE